MGEGCPGDEAGKTPTLSFPQPKIITMNTKLNRFSVEIPSLHCICLRGMKSFMVTSFEMSFHFLSCTLLQNAARCKDGPFQGENKIIVVTLLALKRADNGKGKWFWTTRDSIRT